MPWHGTTVRNWPATLKFLLAIFRNSCLSALAYRFSWRYVNKPFRSIWLTRLVLAEPVSEVDGSMTKIALISDLDNELHREAGRALPDIQLKTAVDVLVLAGNIDVQEHGALYAVAQSEKLGVPVVYVLGNREFHGNPDTHVIDKVRKVTEGTAVSVLDADAVTVADSHFIGATLWTDLELLGKGKKNQLLSFAALNVSDYDKIRRVHKPVIDVFTPTHACIWHEQDRAYIESELAKTQDRKTVVVSHHAPSAQCLSVSEREDLLSACRASALDWMIEKYQPEAWLYGHIDYPNQVQVGKTTVINNPGRHQQSATDYYEPLVIKI